MTSPCDHSTVGLWCNPVWSQITVHTVSMMLNNQGSVAWLPLRSNLFNVSSAPSAVAMCKLPIPPHVMASSAMGLNLGVFGVFADHTHTQRNTKQMHSRSCRGAFYLSSRSNCKTCIVIYTWRTTVILITGKPEDPQIQPHAGIKMAQVLGSLVYICGWKVIHVSSVPSTYKIFVLGQVEDFCSKLAKWLGQINKFLMFFFLSFFQNLLRQIDKFLSQLCTIWP